MDERCETLLLYFLEDAEALHGGGWVTVQSLALQSPTWTVFGSPSAVFWL